MAARPWSAFTGDSLNIRPDLDDGGPEDPDSWEQEIDQVLTNSGWQGPNLRCTSFCCSSGPQ